MGTNSLTKILSLNGNNDLLFFCLPNFSNAESRFCGLDFITAIGATTALANVGPGIGEIIGPSGSFKSLDDIEKYILILAMILGRLELLVAMAFFLPIFWKQ